MAEHYGKYIGGRLYGERQLDVRAQNMGNKSKIFTDGVTVDALEDDTIGLFPVNLQAVPVFDIGKIRFGALGAGVTMDLGFLDDADLGIADASDLLIDDEDVSSAGTVSPFKAIDTVANYGKTFAELLGLDATTQGEAWIVATLKGANPASASLGWQAGVVTG